MNIGKRKLVVPGGSGFLGHAISRFMSDRGWEVVVLSRTGGCAIAGARVVPWDGRTVGPWATEIDGADAVLNLAGRSVNCRYGQANRDQIERSRIESTIAVGEAIGRATHRPAVWLNASTATIYRHAEDRPQDEMTGEIGAGFSVDVARRWERTFFAAEAPGVRKVALRTSIVTGNHPGTAFTIFRRLARFGLAGRLGTGRQYMSWIHIDDFCRAVEFLIERNDLSGVINVTSPAPLRNTDFMRHLRQAAHIPIGLPTPRWLLEIGAFLIRTETELPLKSRYVTPTRLQQAGFEFRYPTWDQALTQLLAERSA